MNQVSVTVTVTTHWLHCTLSTVPISTYNLEFRTILYTLPFLHLICSYNKQGPPQNSSKLKIRCKLSKRTAMLVVLLFINSMGDLGDVKNL